MPSRFPADIAVRRLGRVARWADLQPLVTRRDLRRALEAGHVLRIARGRYALPDVPPAMDVAARVAGVVSHVSAAELHRIPLLLPPAQAHVTVRPNAHPAVPSLVAVHWRALEAAETAAGVTSVLRTVLDCAATLPLPEALAVADGALRLALVTPGALAGAAAWWRVRGAPAVRRVARCADGRAANPFESALRALAIEAGCTGFTPQVQVGAARVDLGDVEARVAIEGDSFEWHGSRQALRRDCRRYDELVRAGWRVLRFAWEDVMFDQDWVRAVIADVVGGGRQNSTVANVPTRLNPTRS